MVRDEMEKLPSEVFCLILFILIAIVANGCTFIEKKRRNFIGHITPEVCLECTEVRGLAHMLSTCPPPIYQHKNQGKIHCFLQPKYFIAQINYYNNICHVHIGSVNVVMLQSKLHCYISPNICGVLFHPTCLPSSPPPSSCFIPLLCK